jgi:hypothetical protein
MRLFYKNTITLIFASLLFSSCYSVKAPQVVTGMTINEFTKEAKHEELVSLENGWTIYRVLYGYNAQNVKFYYFRDNKLVKIDEGRRAIDRRVEIN